MWRSLKFPHRLLCSEAQNQPGDENTDKNEKEKLLIMASCSTLSAWANIMMWLFEEKRFIQKNFKIL